MREIKKFSMNILNLKVKLLKMSQDNQSFEKRNKKLFLEY